jgi:hypothetical protein
MSLARICSAAAGASIGLTAFSASAEEPVPTGQGIAGGALVGAEVTVLTQALVGVEPTWAYLLGGTLSAAAGGYAGYVLERDADPDVSAWLLGGGLAFLIPTVIWVGNARETKRPVDRGAQQASVPPPDVGVYGAARGAQPLERRTVIHLPLLRGVF